MNKAIHFVTNKLVKFRQERDWSQQDLANYLTLQMGRTISQQMIANWESGARALTAESALEISKATKIEVMDLVYQKESK